MSLTLDYSSDLFVVPKETHQWLLSRVKTWKVQRAASRPPSAEGVVVLAGEHGAGKTWLLRHLAERQRRATPPALYLDLDKRTEFASADEYVRAVARRQRDSVGLLLLDHVPPQLDEPLQALEEAILRPHLAGSNPLIVMALTHPSQVCWRTAALRAGERRVLEPFDPAQTRDQLRRLEKLGLIPQGVKPATIQRYSGGLPLLNYLLSTRDRVDAFERLLQYWLYHVPESERECVRFYLDAVCLLDVLELSSIRRMLDAYCRGRTGAPEHPAHPIGLRNSLQKHWLAQPAPAWPGRIVLVSSVQRAARELLRARDARFYVSLEQAAQAPCGG